MHADEILRPLDVLCQAGDRQGRGVGRHDGAALQAGLGLRQHLGLELTVFEHRLDDQVAAFERIVVGCGGDLRQ